MIKARILALEGSPLSSIALPADILNAAGTLWQTMNGQETEPAFEVQVVSPDGQPVRCHRSVSLTPDACFFAMEEADLLIVAGIASLKQLPERTGRVAVKLRQLHRRGTCLASICTGAFVLAASGLLDGRKATTHWAMARTFIKMFPKVSLQVQRIVTAEDNILCSGGTTAGADLSLELVRRYCGEEEARRCSRVLLLDPHRTSQSPYEKLPMIEDHGDPEVWEVQRWVAENYQQEVTVDRLARLARMSRRTFERRFRKVTGFSPLQFLQRVRVEMARHYLETTSRTFDEITGEVGYEDTSSFRRIFHKEMGVSPSVYRERFGQRDC